MFKKFIEKRKLKKMSLKTGFLKYIRTVANMRYYVEKFPEGYYIIKEDIECEWFFRSKLKCFEKKEDAFEECDKLRREYILSEVSNRRLISHPKRLN